MLSTLLKTSCLAVYALALLQFFIPLPYGTALQWVALVLLAAHALELAVFYRHVRKYSGPQLASIVLTLLFGVLHWWPLSRKSH